MFRKAIFTTVTVVAIAVSAVSVTTTGASAKNGKNGAFAAGAILGLTTGAILGAGSHNRHYDRGYDYDRTYYRPRRRCWDKPVKRWDPYYRRHVVVGYKTVCRR